MTKVMAAARETTLVMRQGRAGVRDGITEAGLLFFDDGVEQQGNNDDLVEDEERDYNFFSFLIIDVESDDIDEFDSDFEDDDGKIDVIAIAGEEDEQIVILIEGIDDDDYTIIQWQYILG